MPKKCSGCGSRWETPVEQVNTEWRIYDAVLKRCPICSYRADIDPDNAEDV